MSMTMRARCRALAILMLLAGGALAAPAQAWTPEPATFGVSAPREVHIRMSDGVVLAADVYVPTDLKTGAAAPGRFPVVLAQTPYGKRGAITTRGSGSSALGGDGYYPYLVQRGYVNVVADVRGSGSSDGSFELFGRREISDGVELVHWAAALPESDGRVGTAGESYLGLNQLLVAARIGRRSPLKAIFPVTAGNDLYRDISFMGGITNTEFAGVFAGLRAGMITAVPDDPTYDPADAATRPVTRTGDYAALDGSLYSEIDEGGPRAYADSPFWLARDPSRSLSRIVANRIPAFMVGGWFDVYQRGAALNFAGLQDAWAGRRDTGAPMRARQPVTGRYQLALGPWYHNPTAVGQRLQELQLQWFDTWLKREPTGMARTRTPLHLFQLGDQHWYDTARYPLAGTRVDTMYLGAGSLGDRRPAASSGADQLAWTGETSPCNRGTDQWNTGLVAYVVALAGQPAAPPCDDNDASTQAGALTYTTPPLSAPESVAGPVDATLYVSSSTSDSELVATLEDVAPDGSSFPLTSGALLGSLRATDSAHSWRIGGRLVMPWHAYSAASRTAMTPGKPERLDVELYPTFARIAAGHALRLTITSGTTALVATPAQLPGLVGGVYAVQRHAGAASHVDVPLAAPSSLVPSPVGYGPCNGGCRP
ncbi:MAG: peptidase [Solirubrobacteraceae bacterium]|nr:peptidase [Solirubrobacteraceae bacterium]